MKYKHPNKHIRAAIEYALEHGWRFVKATGHAYGAVLCPNACQCRLPVWSTPRVPENNAEAIRRGVDKCPRPAQQTGPTAEPETPEGSES